MTTASGRSPGDHVCWPFHGMDRLVAAAHEFVLDGLDRRERVAFCKLTPTGIRKAVVSDVTEVGLAPAGDVPVLTALTTDPDWRPSWDPVRSLGPMADVALADGYTGLRVLTDATDLARDPAARLDWVRSEHRIDRYTPGRALTILCAYDVDDLSVDPVVDVACVHARTGAMPCSFLLHAAGPDGRLALTGEVDRSSAVALHHAITAIADVTPGPLVVDLTENAFIDHTGLVAMDRAARAHGTRVQLVGASPLTALLVDAFALTGVSLLDET